jgi:hypothetical protein
MPAKRETKWDAAVMVLRWWKAKGNSAESLFVVADEQKVLPPTVSQVNKKELTTFLAARLVAIDEREIVKFIPTALNNLRDILQEAPDTPDYIRSALDHAIKISGIDEEPPSIHPEGRPSSLNYKPTPLEAPLDVAQEAIHDAAASLVATIVKRWPAHGTDKARTAVRNLTCDRSSDNHLAGYYRVLRWAAPSTTAPVGPRIGQAFAYLKPHTQLKVAAPFASFSLYYRPRISVGGPLSGTEVDGDPFHDDPLRISDGVVMSIGSHMYFIGQEHVEEEASIGTPASQSATRMTSGYPLIVACSLPNGKGNFQGIVLRQTDRESQVLTSRVFFEKLDAAKFGQTRAERYQGIRDHANAQAALYPVLPNGTVAGIEDGKRVLKLLDQELRNVEPVVGVPDGVGRYAITLPIPLT